MINEEEKCLEGGRYLKDGNCKYNKLVFDGNVIVKIENNIYPKIGTNIKFLLQSVVKEIVNDNTQNIDDKKFIYVTFVTTSTKLFLKNWLCNVYSLEEKSINSTIFDKVLLISLDSDLCQEVIKDYKISCLFIPAGGQSNGEIKTIDMLRKWNIFVVDMLKEIIDQGVNIFYFNTNSIWLEDPIMLLKNTTLIDDADIVLPIKETIDQPYHYSPTPILIYSTEASKNFLLKINLHLKSFKNDDLQSNIITEVINELCQVMYYGVICREFSKEDICDLRYHNNSKLPNTKISQTIIFNDFDISINNTQRYHFMKRKKMWFLNSYHKETTKCMVSRTKEIIG